MSDNFKIIRNTVELDASIRQLEQLAISREPRSPFEAALLDQVLVLANVFRAYWRELK